MKKIVLSALAVASLAGTTFGQSIGPVLGSVELRWVERSMPAGTFNGQYDLSPAATPSAAVTNGANPTAAQVTTQDAVVVLMLQAKVTGNVGGPAIRGLRAAGFDITTNQTTGGAFRVYTNSADGSPLLNPRGAAFVGNATTGGNANAGSTNLGFNPSTLVGSGFADRGVVAPFRGIANSESANGPALGVATADSNTLNKVTLGAQTALFGPDQPAEGQYNLLGLDEWVTVYLAIYDISDVTTTRNIVFSIANSPSTPPVSDYGFRTWTGSTNTQNGNLDVWALAPAFTSSPTFTVRVNIPAPGSAALLGLGGLVAARRRRTA